MPPKKRVSRFAVQTPQNVASVPPPVAVGSGPPLPPQAQPAADLPPTRVVPPPSPVQVAPPPRVPIKSIITPGMHHYEPPLQPVQSHPIGSVSTNNNTTVQRPAPEVARAHHDPQPTVRPVSVPPPPPVVEAKQRVPHPVAAQPPPAPAGKQYGGAFIKLSSLRQGGEALPQVQSTPPGIGRNNTYRAPPPAVRDPTQVPLSAATSVDTFIGGGGSGGGGGALSYQNTFQDTLLSLPTPQDNRGTATEFQGWAAHNQAAGTTSGRGGTRGRKKKGDTSKTSSYSKSGKFGKKDELPLDANGQLLPAFWSSTSGRGKKSRKILTYGGQQYKGKASHYLWEKIKEFNSKNKGAVSSSSGRGRASASAVALPMTPSQIAVPSGNSTATTTPSTVGRPSGAPSLSQQPLALAPIRSRAATSSGHAAVPPAAVPIGKATVRKTAKKQPPPAPPANSSNNQKLPPPLQRRQMTLSEFSFNSATSLHGSIGVVPPPPPRQATTVDDDDDEVTLLGMTTGGSGSTGPKKSRVVAQNKGNGNQPPQEPHLICSAQSAATMSTDGVTTEARTSDGRFSFMVSVNPSAQSEEQQSAQRLTSDSVELLGVQPPPPRGKDEASNKRKRKATENSRKDRSKTTKSTKKGSAFVDNACRVSRRRKRVEEDGTQSPMPPSSIDTSDIDSSEDDLGSFVVENTQDILSHDFDSSSSISDDVSSSLSDDDVTAVTTPGAAADQELWMAPGSASNSFIGLPRQDGGDTAEENEINLFGVAANVEGGVETLTGTTVASNATPQQSSNHRHQEASSLLNIKQPSSTDLLMGRDDDDDEALLRPALNAQDSTQKPLQQNLHVPPPLPVSSVSPQQRSSAGGVSLLLASKTVSNLSNKTPVALGSTATTSAKKKPAVGNTKPREVFVIEETPPLAPQQQDGQEVGLTLLPQSTTNPVGANTAFAPPPASGPHISSGSDSDDSVDLDPRNSIMVKAASERKLRRRQVRLERERRHYAALRDAGDLDSYGQDAFAAAKNPSGTTAGGGVASNNKENGTKPAEKSILEMLDSGGRVAVSMKNTPFYPNSMGSTNATSAAVQNTAQQRQQFSPLTPGYFNRYEDDDDGYLAGMETAEIAGGMRFDGN